MHPVLAFFNAMLQLAFVTAVIGLALFYFGRQQFDQPGPLPNTASIIIPKGEGVSAIADRLEQDKVIVDRGLFVGSVVYFTYLRGAGSLKAGEYEFPKHASLRQVLDTLVDGKSVEHKITFPEGPDQPADRAEATRASGSARHDPRNSRRRLAAT